MRERNSDSLSGFLFFDFSSCAHRLIGFFDMPIELDQENVYNSQRKFFDRGRGNGREDNLNR